MDSLSPQPLTGIHFTGKYTSFNRRKKKGFITVVRSVMFQGIIENLSAIKGEFTGAPARMSNVVTLNHLIFTDAPCATLETFLTKTFRAFLEVQRRKMIAAAHYV